MYKLLTSVGFIDLRKVIFQSIVSISFYLALFSSHAHAQVVCDYDVTNQWNDGFTAAIKITNENTNAIHGWSVNWQYFGDNRITSSWNASLNESNPYIATNSPWNATIQPNQTIEFGFQGSKGSADAEIPNVLGGTCSSVRSGSLGRSSTINSTSSLKNIVSARSTTSNKSSRNVSSTHTNSSSTSVGIREASNPVIWADVPDPSVIRVGSDYYMSSTTMHMSPGIPIMKSTDLINWKIINYAYSTLANTNQLNLENGQNAYGKGSWASSIRFVNGTYYVSTFSYTTNKTYIYKTQNIEYGSWSVSVLDGVYHDCSLFFENGRVFLAYGIDDIKLIELTSDASAVKSGGIHQTIIPKSSSIAGTTFTVKAEGTHLQKINGYYYVSLISWPLGKMRTQLVYRSTSLTGPYEGRIAFQDQGIAQGGFVDTPSGAWYAFLFKDSGAVGRTPYLIPVSWQNGWPVLGISGQTPQTLNFAVDDLKLSGVVDSDEFNEGMQSVASLPLQWQWNHNPDNSGWSLLSRPGYLRLTTKRIDTTLEYARNTLTQRTFGPQSSAQVSMDTAGMKDGDYAGLGALQARYGFVGVAKSNGNKAVVMVDNTSGIPQEIIRIGLYQQRVYLKIEMDFRNQIDQAKFYYSLDGTSWTAIGNTLRMTYDLKHFMGYRYALFNFASQSTGGYVDFDYYRLSE